MSGYISREAVIKALCERSKPCFTKNGEPTFKGDYIGAIASIPAADVVEVRHGEWRYRPNLIKAKTRKWPVVECDKCGMSCCDVINCMSEMYHYCPNCGADMREV